jgi:hypothetical protein
MKKSIVCNWLNCLLRWSWLAVTMIGGVCHSQPTALQPVQQFPSAGGDYAVTQVGPHSRVWQNSSGQSVTEIATGMNFWNGSEWTPSDASFAVSADGSSFVATKIQDPTQIAANINTQGAVTAVTPDGVTLRSTPIAIELYDRASGLSAVVATITNSTGVLVDPQHAVYTNAFVGGGFSAAVVYSLPDTGSFHQDVVFTGFNPGFDPTVWGFEAASTNTLEIQIITEFYGTVPQPQTQERDLYVEQNPAVRASMVSPDVIDYTLDFGHYVFGPGRAYTVSASPGTGGGVTVTKDFVTVSGRTFLVESFSYRAIAGMLQSLPPVGVATASVTHPRRAVKTRLAAASVPLIRDAKKASQEKSTPAKISVLTTAEKASMPRGVSVDYSVTVSSTVEPKVYSADTTYFVSGPVYETSQVTMESAVFKYPTSAGYIEVESGLTLSTTNYRTAIFTAADDNSAGSPLSSSIWSGYTGTPTSHLYGFAGLYLTTSGNVALNNLRFCYLNVAIEIFADTAGQTLTLSHSQFVDCTDGVYVEGGNGSNTNASLTFTLYNCLMANVGTPFVINEIVLTQSGYNCTMDTCTNLFNVSVASGAIRFTNSIFSSLTSKGTLGSLTLIGSSDVFYKSTGATFGTFNTLSASPYVTAGAGNYYITNNSSYLTNGSTVIPAALLAQLQMKTTQAPLWLTNTFPYSTIITPVVPRDTAGTALGWHYDSIDYLASCGLSISNTLTLTNGVALAYYDNKGIFLPHYTQLYSQGTPNQRNYLVYYGLVQDQPISINTNVALGVAAPFSSSLPDSKGPAIFLRFTTICAPTGETNLLNTGDASPYEGVHAISLRDCEIYGSGAIWAMNDNTNTPTVELTNNVFYRVPFAITNNATISCVNNLFYGTTNANEFAVVIRHLTGASPNANQDNVYNGVTASLDGTVLGHNGYLNGAVNVAGGTGTDNTNTIVWQAGPLGSFYQSSGGPEFQNGSTTAANLGLYHYTVLTSETPEESSTVSRGYHYVALTNTTGLPLDSNNDGVPDYLEDTNGDGVTDDGETNWNSSTPPWIGTQPVSQYAVQGAAATFTVQAYGSAPLSYQWTTNGGNISGATSNAYTIASAPSSDTWEYAVKISSSYGSVTSSNVTLTIVVPPQLADYSPPTNGQFWYQSTWDLLIAQINNPSYGSPTPAYYSQYLNTYLQYMAGYQFQYNGTNLPFGSGTFATLNFAYYYLTNDGGTYTLIMTNAAGTTTLTWTNLLQANPGMVENWGDNSYEQCNRPVTLTNASGIAAGEYQSIAVTATGSVFQWGDYSDGTDFYPVSNATDATQPPTNGIIAVAAGLGQGLALTTSNTVIAWGLNGEYGTEVPTDLNLTNVTAIGCGWQFNVALRNNGTVTAWGYSAPSLGYTMTNVPPGLSNVTAIACGAAHTLALVSNGTVVAWGYSPDGETNVPAGLTNVVGVAAGESHSMALLANGNVVAWGLNDDGQTNVPPSVSSNVTAIAAGDDFSMALLNNGSIVEWGYNGSGQTNVPQSNPAQPVVVKYIAGGGNHSMAAIWSPSQQYPVNASRDVLLVYTTQSALSTNVFNYYRTNRPLATNFNTLGINCPAGETISWYDYTNSFVAPIVTWLNSNQMKWPKYVILFPDLPSRLMNAAMDATCSVQYDMNSGYNAAFQTVNNYAPGWHPYVTAINMNGLEGSNDCFAYVNKLTNMAGGKQTLFISASSNGYGNVNWYFDDANAIHGYSIGLYAEQGVESSGVSSSDIFYAPLNSTINISRGTNVAGYYTWGWDTTDQIWEDYSTNGNVIFGNASTWYLMGSVESFNGQRNGDGSQSSFLNWFSTNAFMGTNSTLALYTNTPVGAISHVDEPQEFADNTFDYFGLWASGKCFAICSWAGQTGTYPADLGYLPNASDFWFQATGDPFVTK